MYLSHLLHSTSDVSWGQLRPFGPGDLSSRVILADKCAVWVLGFLWQRSYEVTTQTNVCATLFNPTVNKFKVWWRVE